MPATPKTAYDYKCLSITNYSPSQIEAILKTLGQEGWLLITSTLLSSTYPNYLVFYKIIIP